MATLTGQFYTYSSSPIIGSTHTLIGFKHMILHIHNIVVSSSTKYIIVLHILK
jgi:hypothetical protein